MTALTGTAFVRYARTQICHADRMLITHRDQGSMCSCGRVLPCSVADSIRRRQRHFVDQLAAHAAPTVVAYAAPVASRSGPVGRVAS